MTWIEDHQKSEKFASEADQLARSGHGASAVGRYAEAAKFEEVALSKIDRNKSRTLGIIAVSAASLWFKGCEFKRAESVALSMLSEPSLPRFAAHDLRALLHDVWTEEAKSEVEVGFLKGHLNVSLKGDEVVFGGAPLDLIVEKVQAIQSIFYRTIEWMKGVEPRVRGAPNADITSSCRPWLFQAAPGSYQFSVAIQEPPQSDFFHPALPPDRVVQEFIEIVSASISTDREELNKKVDDPKYRSAFLKLSRNLAPNGKSISTIEMKEAGSRQGITMAPQSRRVVSDTIRRSAPAAERAGEVFDVQGVLRAVNLNKDWLEVSYEGRTTRVTGVRDTMDDVIGPMVNRRVIVRAGGTRAKPRLIDIELDG